MIAALILVGSVLALVQFAIAQWKSIWLTVAAQPLSSCLEAATGLSAKAIGPYDFDRLAQVLQRLSPVRNRDNRWMKEVRFYYRAVRAFSKICAMVLPSGSKWAANELTSCSKYAAALVDQQLNADLAYASALEKF